jgi:hypothetical protein
VKKILTTVPVRRPHPHEWSRVHPDPGFRADFPILELKEEGGETFVVHSNLVPELLGEWVSKTLFTTINRQGVVSLWPVRLPTSDGKDNDWWRSAREAAERAQREWVRIKSNKSLGAYEIFQPEGVMSDPVWPDVTFGELIRLAFKNNLIEPIDHPVIKRLRGAI